MVTVTKYLTQADLKRKICDCNEEERLKVLFKEVSELELKIRPEQGMTGAHILRNEKIIVFCEFCKKVYFIMTRFEGGIKESFVSINSLDLFNGSMKELRNIINNMFEDYENEIITIATDDYTIKVIDKYEDEERIITNYSYLNREDKNLYKDLLEN